MGKKIDLLSPADVGWVERPDRVASNRPATVRRADGSAVAAHLTNLSDVGCCVESEERFDIGERVQITLPRMGELAAQIRWTVNGRAGVRFDTASR